MSTTPLTNLYAKAGDTFSLPLTYLDDNDQAIDLTGYTAEFSLAVSPGDANAFSYSDTGSEITIDAPNGKITIEVGRVETRKWGAGQYIYEITIVSGGGIATTILEGKLYIRSEVSA